MANSVKTGRKLHYRCLLAVEGQYLPLYLGQQTRWFEVDTGSSLGRLRNNRLLDGIADGIAVKVIDVPLKFVRKNHVTKYSTPVLGLIAEN